MRWTVTTWGSVSLGAWAAGRVGGHGLDAPGNGACEWAVRGSSVEGLLDGWGGVGVRERGAPASTGQAAVARRWRSVDQDVGLESDRWAVQVQRTAWTGKC